MRKHQTGHHNQTYTRGLTMISENNTGATAKGQELSAAWAILSALQLHIVKEPSLAENGFYQEVVAEAHSHYALLFARDGS